MTFSLGAEPDWLVVGSVSIRFLWLDEDDGSFSWDGTMVRLHDTAKLHNGTTQWYDEMVRWHNMSRWRDGTMAQYTMAKLHNDIVFSLMC